MAESNLLIPRKEAISISNQITNALASLHACEIAHRNLNPATIWLEFKDEETIVKIGGFEHTAYCHSKL